MDSNTVKAILFDLDNTLIETSRAGGQAIQKVRLSKDYTDNLVFEVNLHSYL